MLKLLLTTVQVLIGVYWAGAIARQNPHIDAFLKLMEGGYAGFNSRLKDADFQTSVSHLRKFYGWFAVAVLVSFIFFGRLVTLSPSIGTIWSLSFVATFFGWFSLKWCLDHKRTVKELGPNTALMIFAPFLMAGMDSFADTGFTKVLAEPLVRSAHLLGVSSPNAADPWLIAAVFSGLFMLCFAIMYSLTWLSATPMAFLSLALVAIPVWLARLVHAIDPKNTFFWFSVVIMLGVSWWLSAL